MGGHLVPLMSRLRQYSGVSPPSFPNAADLAPEPQRTSVMDSASRKTTIRVKGLKVNTLLPPAALPADLVPPEPQPAGNPVIELEMEGSPFIVRAVLNGKAVRRAIKTIAEHGANNVNVLL